MDENLVMERMAPDGYTFLEIIVRNGVSHKKYEEIEKTSPGTIIVQSAYRSNGKKLPDGYIGMYALSSEAGSVRRWLYRQRVADGTQRYAGHNY
ncbi:MAG: hypothetical protein MNSN_08800 [Minisyncoccus archaeiphilus]|uniref:hypothetical protein n=1 Tax=Minisyncoccus archaeiphilus TaxID=3238481 RepID=UPI002B167498|nr:MAG: hypothetical protein MNSN_08800 [Candidatus Parcubacteria bacterium]